MQNTGFMECQAAWASSIFAHFKVKLKAEFQGSNYDMYRSRRRLWRRARVDLTRSLGRFG